ncbi:hypothetical protein Tco_0884327 [Tanacetum coccineum]
MLQICPRLPGQKFKDPPFEEEILYFIRDLGHTREIKVLTDVNVNHMHQPWRSFAAIINRCLSEKPTSLDSLCLLHAQIIWGMYQKKNVDYVYLLWEDLDTHIYGAILPNELTNQDIKDSEAYKLYYTVASGAEPPKSKYKKKADEPVTPSKKKTVPTSKGAVDGPEVPNVPEYKLESKEESWIFSQGNDDDDNDEYDLEDEKYDEDDDDKNDNSQEEEKEEEKEDDDDEVSSDQKVSTPPEHELTKEEEANKEDNDTDMEGDQEQNKDDDLYRDVNINLERSDAEMTDAQANKETKDAYVNLTAVPPFPSLLRHHLLIQQFLHHPSPSFNLYNKHQNPRQQQLFQQRACQIFLTLHPYFGLNNRLYHEENNQGAGTSSASLVDVPVSTTVEMPPSSAITIPLPPVTLIQPLQQTPVSTPTIVPSTSLQNLPTFDSVFKFEDRVKALEDDFSEFKQTNQFTAVISSIPGIIDTYLANKMNEAIKTAV